MEIRELAIPDSYVIAPKSFEDDRGVFLEWYRFDKLEERTGRSFEVKQANTSVSAKGTVRGIHFADVPPSQAKYVTVSQGSVIDFIVDIRVGSPTFGEWDSVHLDNERRNAVFLSEGLGHCFVALTEGATVSYLVSDTYNPEREHGISPLDPDIALDLPFGRDQLRLSPKDINAPSLSEARRDNLLPTWDTATAFYARATEGQS
ncbi:dTDP-4-dehydrorhamnose 3,5-epimerase family protein [Microbacterium sp. MPKO10]|uniref:dTDP-4-dehydrorhamnose 3,5-epimerase family protein n=1 Tax=Microbacterium sp. MPKO10 TaxID=2989818 RepID=UPI00223625EF|nr:dTDP-4-dehydrorhamnose 3,5-epimerase [Microbacterium sp. MPKO10]MCW4458629.1 dTDP-4-dehydrorhamnose 3,5-epimerase [Microbacterium sp. MPKO10]